MMFGAVPATHRDHAATAVRFGAVVVSVVVCDVRDADASAKRYARLHARTRAKHALIGTNVN